MRCRVPIEEVIAGPDIVAFIDRKMLAFRNEIFDWLRAFLFRTDRDTTLGLVILAEFDEAVRFRDNGMVLRTPRFEKLGHPGQTTGNILRFGTFAWNTGQHVTGLNVRAVFNREDCVNGQEVAGLMTAWKCQDFSVASAQGDTWTQIASFRLRFPVDNDLPGDTGGFVHLLRHGDTADKVLIADRTFNFRDNRRGERIPLGQLVALLDRRSIINEQPRTIGNTVARPLPVIVIDENQFRVPPHHNRISGAVDNHIAVFEPDRAIMRRIDRGNFRNLRGTTDMEGPHGQLGPGLTDRLRCDNADSLTNIDRCSARQITTITFGADTAFCLARQNRSDQDLLDTGGFRKKRACLIKHLAASHDHFAC